MAKNLTRVKSQRLVLEDSIDKSEVVVEPGYGGILFVSHFALSKVDARRLSEFLGEQVQWTRNEWRSLVDKILGDAMTHKTLMFLDRLEIEMFGPRDEFSEADAMRFMDENKELFESLAKKD